MNKKEVAVLCLAVVIVLIDLLIYVMNQQNESEIKVCYPSQKQK